MARLIHAVLVVFTFAFDLSVALFLLGIGAVAFSTGQSIRFDLIPLLRGSRLIYALCGIGALGVLALALSFGRTKILRLPLLAWNLGVLSLLVCAFTRSSYRFGGWDDFMDLVWLTVLAILALWGSWSHLRRTPVA